MRELMLWFFLVLSWTLLDVPTDAFFALEGFAITASLK